MTTLVNDPPRLVTARVCFAQTLALVLLGLLPFPLGWAATRSAMESARSHELNRSDRDEAAGGYYEGLIGGPDGPQGARADLARALLGKPSDWDRIETAKVMRNLPDRDFLQFDLKPNLNKRLFGQPFTTNSHGMRDREYTLEKPENTFRIAVLGSSIDMGWGLGTEETYVSLLEDWLNAHAARHGLARKFEVLNFAVAAYSPLQRLEAFRRKAREFAPDMVIYSATMLDTRLMEIHLCDLFRAHADLSHDFLRQAVSDAGVTDEDLRTVARDVLVNKEIVKKKLRPFYWPIYDAMLGALAADCRSDGVPLVCLIIPRVGKADAPASRAESVARIVGMAAHHAIPVYDLAGTFDGQDPAEFEIAPWDDHPNAKGHRRLFKAMSGKIRDDPETYRMLFQRPLLTETAAIP